MKQLLLTTIFAFLSIAIFAQGYNPGFSYQAVIRNDDGELSKLSSVTIEIELYSSSSDRAYFEEVHQTTTNLYGQVAITIGEGSNISGNLKDVPWSEDQIYYRATISSDDLNIRSTHESKLLAVPLAYHSFTSDALSGNLEPGGSRNEFKSWYLNGNELPNDNYRLGSTNPSSFAIVTNDSTRIMINNSGPIEFFKETFYWRDASFHGKVRMDNGLNTSEILVDNRAKVLGDFGVGGNTLLRGDLDVLGTQTNSSDLKVEGSMTIDGDQTVHGNTYLNSEVNIQGPTNISNTFNVTGVSNFDDDVTLQKNLFVNNELTVGGNSDLNGNVDIEKNLSVQQNLIVNGDSDLNGDVDVSDDLVVNKNLTVKQNSLTEGDMTVDGSTVLEGNLTTKGLTTFVGNTVFDNGIDVPTLNVQGASTLNTLSVSGTSNLSQLNVSGNSTLDRLTVTNTTNLNTLNVNGNADFSQNIDVSGYGKFGGKLFADSDAEIQGDLYVNKEGFFFDKTTYSGEATFNNTVNLTRRTNLKKTVIDYNASNNDFDNADAYPLVVKGSKHGVYIQSNVSNANMSQDVNFISFVSSDNEIKGRIEGQSLADLATHWPTVWNNTMSAFELGALAAEGVACGAQADVAEVAVMVAQGVIQAANIAEFNTTVNLEVGVAYESASGDYAEWLLKSNPNEVFTFGDVVGVKGGKISKSYSNPDHYMVVSMSPIVLGNSPKDGNTDLYEKVAFMGQVPVKTIGQVEIGDYIIASDRRDGLAYARSVNSITLEEMNRIVGVAWSTSNNDNKLNYINVAVGINTNDLVTIVKNQQRQLDGLSKKVDQLYAMVTGEEIETKQIEPILEVNKEEKVEIAEGDSIQIPQGFSTEEEAIKFIQKYAKEYLDQKNINYMAFDQTKRLLTDVEYVKSIMPDLLKSKK